MSLLFLLSFASPDPPLEPPVNAGGSYSALHPSCCLFHRWLRTLVKVIMRDSMWVEF